MYKILHYTAHRTSLPIGTINSKFQQPLTAKKMIFQAPTCHVFIDQQPVFTFTAIPNELHKILVTELT